MHDLLIALVYIGMFLLPIVIATKNTPKIGKDDLEPEPKPLPGRKVWR